MKYILLSCFYLLVLPSFGVNLDSLQRIVSTSRNDSLRIDANNKLIWQYLFADKEKALALIQRSERISKRPNTAFGYTALLGIKGVYYDVNGKADSAEYYFTAAYKESKHRGYIEQENHALTNLGMFHWNRGNNRKALNYFFQSIRQSQKVKDPKFKDQSSNYSNIGLIYQEMKLFEKALNYHRKALNTRLKLTNKRGIASSYYNMGICYKNLNQLEIAQEYYDKGLRIAKKINDQILIYQLQNGIAGIWLQKGFSKDALPVLLSSLNRGQHIPYTDLDRLSDLSNISKAYILERQADSALFYIDSALRFMRNSGFDQESHPELYLWKGEALFMMGSLTSGTACMDTFHRLTELKFNYENARYLQELEVEFEAEKRDKEIAEKRLKIQQQNNVIIFVLGAFILLLLISIQTYLRKSAKNKKLLLEKRLTETLSDFKTKEELYRQRLEISQNLHDNIGSQLTFISAVVDQLKMKDLSTADNKQKLNELGAFIRQLFQELRDTVWAMNQNSISGEELLERIIRLTEQADQLKDGLHATVHSHQVDSGKLVLSTMQCLHILGIVKEALSNAVKHAEATEIVVNLGCEKDQFVLEIIDNGKGYDPAVPSNGFGLDNMRKRASAIGTEITVYTGIQGTTIRLQLHQDT